jgi:Uri superfamily endonuclease|tara:strand:+ start:2501 stop:2842 length:342 start_codon:yes stop_codon:yes gene_type:complete
MQSYQLIISLSQNINIQIGKLGLFSFQKGTYVYAGSAKRNMDARIKRHLSKDKNLHWHIDYLLANKQTKIIKVIKSELSECDLNGHVKGKIIAKGFGSSDCKENCKSHLKFIS